MPHPPQGDTVLSPSPLLPPAPSFTGHQTFAVRSGWLKKGIDALANPEAGGASVFTRDDAIVTLGVGKNMVTAIRHWLLATSMVEECPGTRGRELAPSRLGATLFGSPGIEGWDSYLEDETTLWLLHWHLAGPGSLSFTWVWTFNCLRDFEFTRDSLRDAILRAVTGRVPKRPSQATVERDVDCLLHTYVAPKRTDTEDSLDCPLATLGLIHPSFERHYRFSFGPKPSLAPSTFAYALVRFWKWRSPGATAISLWDVVNSEGSPGLVFRLDEDSVMEYLDSLEDISEGALRFEDTAQVRQVVRQNKRLPDPLRILARSYGGSHG